MGFRRRNKNKIRNIPNYDKEESLGEIELIPTYIEAIHASQSDDYNGDGEVNVADINALIDYILSY